MTTPAKRYEQRRLRRGTGLETLVDYVATAVLILGCIIALLLLFAFSVPGLFSALYVLCSALVTWLLFRCLAEHLRLQKKIAGCDYEGEITGPVEETIWACGNCNQMLHSDHRCESCGAEIIPEDS